MAIDFTIEQRVPLPVEDVFAFVTDPARLPEWDLRVVDARLLPPATAVGPLVRIREVRALGRRRIEQIVQVSAYDPPRRFGLRILEGPFPVDGDLTFEALGESQTLVRLHAHGHAPRRLRRAERLLAAVARLGMRRQYRRLADVLRNG